MVAVDVLLSVNGQLLNKEILRMEHIKYIIRIAVVTMIVIMVMQMKMNGYTLETHAETFIRTSSATSIVRDVAEGGFFFAKSAYQTTAKTVDSFFTKNFRDENSPGRKKIAEMRKSLGFKTEKEKKLEAKNKKDEEASESETY